MQGRRFFTAWAEAALRTQQPALPRRSDLRDAGHPWAHAETSALPLGSRVQWRTLLFARHFDSSSAVDSRRLWNQIFQCHQNAASVHCRIRSRDGWACRRPVWQWQSALCGPESWAAQVEICSSEIPLLGRWHLDCAEYEHWFIPTVL